jgi:hypothetical protein
MTFEDSMHLERRRVLTEAERNGTWSDCKTSVDTQNRQLIDTSKPAIN